MSSFVFDANGVLRASMDDAALPRTYRLFDATGTQTFSRPYTAAENAAADAEGTSVAAEANRRSIETALASELDEIQTEFLAPSNPTLTSAFNANPARYLKILARIIRHVIRLLIRRLDGAA